MTENQKANVDHLRDAKPGDTVWQYDSQRNVYDNGKYLGRGGWQLVTIESETRRSFTILRTKFDRATGEEMGNGQWSKTMRIAGQIEYEIDKARADWFRDHYPAVRRLVDAEQDVERWKQIAAIVGYEPS